MDKYNGETKYITGYDGKQHKTTFKPAPSEVEIKRRPTESMLWQMRHKPYGSAMKRIVQPCESGGGNTDDSGNGADTCEISDGGSGVAQKEI